MHLDEMVVNSRIPPKPTIVTFGKTALTSIVAAIAMDYFQDQVLHTGWPERPFLDASAASVANYVRIYAEHKYYQMRNR